MNILAKKLHNHAQRKKRVRSKVSGTTERPRLSITVSNLHVSAQIIDDTTSKTIASATSVGNKNAKGNLTAKAKAVGTEIAVAAIAKKVSLVVFDRNGHSYHGRVKALAEAARAGGLKF